MKGGAESLSVSYRALASIILSKARAGRVDPIAAGRWCRCRYAGGNTAAWSRSLKSQP